MWPRRVGRTNRSEKWGLDGLSLRPFHRSFVVVLCVQLLEEPAGSGPDSDAVDVAHLKAVRGGPKRLVVDEDAVDDCPDRFCSVSVDDSSDR